MKYEILNWDSEFFGISIGKLSLGLLEVHDFEQVLKNAKADGIKLLYWFVNPEDEELNRLARMYSLFLADEKTTFTKRIRTNTEIDSNIVEYSLSKPSVELFSLAQQSGEYSRFKVDSNFPTDACKNLYDQWIINSVNKKFADSVLTYLHNSKLVGMITLQTKNRVGNIGLIGVDTAVRGQNIGSKLIAASEKYFTNLNISVLDVVTQKANTNACRFYVKNGFDIKTVENVYHIWL